MRSAMRLAKVRDARRGKIVGAPRRDPEDNKLKRSPSKLLPLNEDNLWHRIIIDRYLYLNYIFFL